MAPWCCLVRLRWQQRLSTDLVVTMHSPATSTPRSMTSTGRRKRVRRGVVDIEQVFASMSSARAHGGMPSPSRTMLSPRSAEACLREGVDPEELKVCGCVCANACGCGSGCVWFGGRLWRRTAHVCVLCAGWLGCCRSAISTRSGNRALTRLRSVCAMRLTVCAATKR